MTTTTSGCISIVRIPEGEAPLWVRRAWVGILLPCDPYSGPGEDRGAMSGQTSDVRSCFGVSQGEAIGLLASHNAEAARWWKRQGYPRDGECFGFSKADAVILGDVTPHRAILIPEDRMDDPNR